jgi:hypothetical protein
MHSNTKRIEKQSHINSAHSISALKVVGGVCLAVLLTACSSKPGVEDIEPYLVKDNFGLCPLWTVHDVKKTDGAELENAYRIDYSAVLTLKKSPRETVDEYLAHEHDPVYEPCTDSLTAMLQLTLKSGQKLINSEYQMNGFAGFIKSEKGWRIATGIKNTFTPM